MLITCPALWPGPKAWGASTTRFSVISGPMEPWQKNTTCYAKMVSSERAIFIIDKQGIIRYIDIHDIDEQPSNEVLFAELRRIDPEAAARHPQEQGPCPRYNSHTVGLCCIAANGVPDCRRVRHWLKQRNLEFAEVDVNAVPEAARQVREWSGGNLITPTVDVDGTIVLDFDQERLSGTAGQITNE